jgi:trans-L-3-hydroxyproline dehydratase
MHLDWSQRDPRPGKMVLTTLDAHAAGEPLRIVTGGWPDIPGATMLERRRHLLAHLDNLRRALMREPRGHADMYGCVVTPPTTAGADLGVLFMHNDGLSTMCGHGIIALVTALLETGALPARGPQTPLAIDTPAGLVRAMAHVDGQGRVEQVSFQNVPSFLYRQDLAVDVPGLGTVRLDIAFGGAFYAVLAARQVGRRVDIGGRAGLQVAAAAIKAAVQRQVAIEHPLEPELGFLYGVIFVDEPEDPAHHSRNLCVFANGEVDRSPTGTGVSARLALHHARGEVHVGQEIVVESLLGRRSVFRGRVVAETQCGPYPAVVPEVSGQAFLTGRHEFFLDPADPLAAGFLV